MKQFITFTTLLLAPLASLHAGSVEPSRRGGRPRPRREAGDRAAMPGVAHRRSPRGRHGLAAAAGSCHNHADSDAADVTESDMRQSGR